ncbi:cell division protein FtsL [Alkalibacterium subtropicum]|uniref:Cell division protein FtsL n=1 Tax=Alkalibacterium subtropicum TaxID=753702 RepID=A0A1I1ED80_9LACT|nr:cell division protein FtsL [Alkalibacterium subtropicum]SFB84726.1 cell division protein FtsL [Alkalibacterium subtropicum]
MMNDNLARQFVNEVQPIEQPKTNETRESKKRLHKKGLTRMEMAVSSLFGVVLFGMAVGHIALSMQVSTTNRSIQDIEAQAAMVQVENSNFEQNVQELSRYDRVYSIAKENDLKMNEEQIRNVFK